MFEENKYITKINGTLKASSGDFSGMFKNCSSLKDINCLKVDKTKKFTLNLNEMFYNCCSLKNIDRLL